MLNKNLMLLIFIVLIFSLSITSVNSQDINESISTNNIDPVENLTIEDAPLLSKSYTVNGGSFDDIQDCIDNAKSGDTINLEGSFKSEGKAISINKKLTIKSSNKATRC